MSKTVAIDTASLTEALTAPAIVELTAAEVTSISGGNFGLGGEPIALSGELAG